MQPPIQRIKLSQAAKDQLIKLKRNTKIEQWNILCRWAFCRSLAEPNPPSPTAIKLDSNIEMSWQVFAGEMSNVLILAFKQYCQSDDKEVLARQFLLHLHRGIAYLAGDTSIKKIEDLILLPSTPNTARSHSKM